MLSASTSAQRLDLDRLSRGRVMATLKLGDRRAVVSAHPDRIESPPGGEVSLLRAGFVADSFRWGSSHAPWYETVAILCASAVMVLVCALTLVYLRRRDWRSRPVGDQWSALAVMGDLCPDGWLARITLRGGTGPTFGDRPSPGPRSVELEWRQFDGPSGRVVAARRLSAPTIAAAMQAMVEDRSTDMTLEEIEQAAAERDDLVWSD